MEKQEFLDGIVRFVNESPANFITEDVAIRPDIAGMKMFGAPLVGFAAADDSLFSEEFKKPGVIHPDYVSPREWLPGAATVISFFLPFTDRVKDSNRGRYDESYQEGLALRASPEWLHARIEGQDFVNLVTSYIQTLLAENGFQTVCPTTSGLLRKLTPYITTWSERHAAYAAGLGTFGLSKGLITEKGMAGRFGSVITDAVFAPDVRPYSSPFEYCIMCGACMAKCPVGAIDATRGCALGKDQNICGPYVSTSKLPPHGPKQRVRYGCGKCQIGVPCESGIPAKSKP